MGFLSGYRGFITISDGQHSICVDGRAEITLKAKGRTTKVYQRRVDRGKKYTNSYSDRYTTTIMGTKITQGREVIKEERYGMEGGGFYRDKDTFIPYAQGTWTSRHGEIVKRTKLFGLSGVCRTKFCRGKFLGQRFYWSNGRKAYSFDNKQNTCVVRYPNGKVAYEYISNSPICKGDKQDTMRFEGQREGKPIWARGENHAIDHKFAFYNKRGKVQDKGEYKNRQQVGEWVVKGIAQYWANGMLVDKDLFFSKPEDIKAEGVLRQANAQVRAMLLKKIGLERLVKEAKGTRVDYDKDTGNELYDFKCATKGDTDEMDRFLRILKVVCPSTKQNYFLRIPYHKDFNTCEKARQGTFNEFEPSKVVKFALET